MASCTWLIKASLILGYIPSMCLKQYCLIYNMIYNVNL